MSSTTVAEFAAELKKSADTLLEQLRAAGVSKLRSSDVLSDQDAKAAEFLRQSWHCHD